MEKMYSRKKAIGAGGVAGEFTGGDPAHDEASPLEMSRTKGPPLVDFKAIDAKDRADKLKSDQDWAAQLAADIAEYGEPDDDYDEHFPD